MRKVYNIPTVRKISKASSPFPMSTFLQEKKLNFLSS